MENKTIYLSKDTLDKYKEEYEKLVKVDRVEIQNALKEARAQGDLSENAEYDAARERQSIVESRISELEAILDNAVVIETANNESIGIGSQVTFIDLETNEELTIQIMGTHDANPVEGKISDKSPLALAMMSKYAGDEVEVEAPHKYSIKILNVKNIY